ncbi:MAG TPA: hypothetical protein VMD07_05875 [Candidatus Acidoferrales bacterium]|nr:hypothetical protein [Candidatus Acidoferrales bacterium]
MNTLTDRQRERILTLLRQGKSLRRIEFETGHRRETIAIYGRRAGLINTEATDISARRVKRQTPAKDRQMLAA